MSTSARWFRTGVVDALDLLATSTGLATAQDARAAPLVIWAQAQGPICLGSGATATELVWADARAQVFVLIVPRRMAPGRSTRWVPWLLAPAVATFRELGLAACLDGSEIGLRGHRIAGGSAAVVGDCVVMASSFPWSCLDGPSQAHGLLAPEAWPWIGEGAVLERTFRSRLEAQHGWQFEHSWPSAAERAVIERARSGLREPAGASSALS